MDTFITHKTTPGVGVALTTFYGRWEKTITHNLSAQHLPSVKRDLEGLGNSTPSRAMVTFPCSKSVNRPPARPAMGAVPTVRSADRYYACTA
jgi:hypothetical protein